MAHLDNIPPFNPSDSGTVALYQTLFTLFGSHVVVGADYGGRFQLVCSTTVHWI